jgi:prolyl-tRNA synthetase
VGKREMEQGVVELYRRDTGEKRMVAVQDVAKEAETLLYTMQKDLLVKNKQFREANTVRVETYEDFKQALDAGKFVMAHRDGTAETEAQIKKECQCVTRCIPFNSSEEV